MLTIKRGGVVVYRVALWHPSLVSLLFSVCTPFGPPRNQHVPLETQVETVLPNFRYQLQFISGAVETNVSSNLQIRQLLNAMYGGRGPLGEHGFTVSEGLIFENLPLLRPTQLLNDKVQSRRCHDLHQCLTMSRKWTIMLSNIAEMAYIRLVSMEKRVF